MSTNQKIEVAILCPIRLEFETVWRCLHNPTPRQDNTFHNPIPYDFGTLRTGELEWNVGLFETGSGVSRLREITTQVLYAFQPDYIFLVGIAGGIKDVAIGDVVVATKAYGYESGKEGPEDFMARPESVNHTRLLDLVRSIARDYQREKSLPIFLGAIASGEKVLANLSSETVKRIKTHYNDTLAVEMESIGFAHAAETTDIPFFNIRGISDLLENKNQTERDGSRPKAAVNATDFTIHLLAHLPKNTKIAAEETVAQHSVEVHYLDAPFRTSLQIRYTPKGTLHFYADRIVLKKINDRVEIQKVLAVERVAMPGDISASWVMVDFERGGKKETLYFSDSRLPGWSNLVGGGKKLCKKIETYLSLTPINPS